MRGAARLAVVGAAYVVVMTAWIYAVLNTDRENAGFWGSWWPAALLVALHFVIGLAIGRWNVLALTVLPVLIAVPAGDFSDGYPEVPVSVYTAAQLILFGLPGLALGALTVLVLEKVRDSGRSSGG